MRSALVAMIICGASVAHAQEAPVVYKAPPPYSLPWQLRPAAVANVLRSDTSVAFYEDATGAAGSTTSTSVLASYKVTPEIAPLLRLGFIYNDAPGDEMPTGQALVNPLLGATYAKKAFGLRLAGFVAVTLPIGQGGGDSPDRATAAAAASGVPARSAMDNAMFAVNYAAGIAGFDVAWVGRGVTVQAEATVLQLERTRGPDMQDKRRTNMTGGLHAGWFALPWLSVGGELRYQRWLSDAAPVRMNDEARETATAAIGPRLHFDLGGGKWLRPGLSYTQVLDAPFATSEYKMLQIDVPFVF
jgi:hypothetical protein